MPLICLSNYTWRTHLFWSAFDTLEWIFIVAPNWFNEPFLLFHAAALLWSPPSVGFLCRTLDYGLKVGTCGTMQICNPGHYGNLKFHLDAMGLSGLWSLPEWHKKVTMGGGTAFSGKPSGCCLPMVWGHRERARESTVKCGLDFRGWNMGTGGLHRGSWTKELQIQNEVKITAVRGRKEGGK